MGFRAQLEGLALDKKLESASQYQVGGKCGCRYWWLGRCSEYR